jgi:DNA-binding transcriptional regulator/RsmH inhibitor MraZ
MTRKPKRRSSRRFEISRDAQLGIAWYTREAWERLRQVADDVQALDKNYEAWERGALAAVRDLECIGRPAASRICIT